MKIYSWNMLYRNKELDRAFEFISHSDFDIFCLQEVPASLLEELKALPCHNVYRIDMVKFFSSGTTPTYNVILSRHRITNQGDIPHPEYWHLLPLRTRLFIYLMRPFFFSKLVDRSGVYADILIGEQTIRVFNLHLILGHPTWRLAEFEQALVHRERTQPTVVCGDFNTLEKPHITILNWLGGGSISDAFRYSRERLQIEKRFVAHELTNALSGTRTHSLARSQLDHILVSHSFTIKNAEVLPDRMGSDHHPICVEVA